MKKSNPKITFSFTDDDGKKKEVKTDLKTIEELSKKLKILGRNNGNKNKQETK